MSNGQSGSVFVAHIHIVVEAFESLHNTTTQKQEEKTGWIRVSSKGWRLIVHVHTSSFLLVVASPMLVPREQFAEQNKHESQNIPFLFLRSLAPVPLSPRLFSTSVSHSPTTSSISLHHHTPVVQDRAACCEREHPHVQLIGRACSEASALKPENHKNGEEVRRDG